MEDSVYQLHAEDGLEEEDAEERVMEELDIQMQEKKDEEAFNPIIS